ALLGILKAGGAYVPVDTSLPEGRRELIRRDSGAVVHLATEDVAPQRLAIESDARGRRRHEPTSAAYPIYTSGTTGTATAVVAMHRGVVRLVKNAGYLRFRADQVFLQHSAFAFDASVFEIWAALLNGAELVVAEPGKLELESYARLLRTRCISNLLLAP